MTLSMFIPITAGFIILFLLVRWASFKRYHSRISKMAAHQAQQREQGNTVDTLKTEDRNFYVSYYYCPHCNQNFKDGEPCNCPIQSNKTNARN